MLTQPIIIDDVVSKSYQDLVENEFLSNRLPWFFVRDVSYNQNDEKVANVLSGKTQGMAHLFFNIDQGIITPGIHFLMLPLALEAFSKANIDPGFIVRGRSFMHFPINNNIRREHDSPHIDYDTPHLVCLYYVNDSDGDTVIFDKSVKDVHPEFNNFSETEFKIVQRISPKKGRVVLFDGTTYHASSTPTTDVRCIVNMNFSYKT